MSPQLCSQATPRFYLEAQQLMGKVANVTIHDLHSVTWCVASLMAHLISVSVCKQIKLPSLKLATYKLQYDVCISPSSLSSSPNDYRTIAEILYDARQGVVT